jgi:chaperonin GroES
MAKDIKIQPLGKRILVKPAEIEEKTAGGLVIPPTSGDDKRPETGEIVKLGIGKDDEGKEVKFDVKVGDRVYFKKYSPEEVEVDGEKYLIIDIEDILAVIK